MEVSNQILKIVEQRISKDSELFFIDTDIYCSQFGLNIIKRKKLFGVSLNSEIILPTIYDEIILLTCSVIATKIDNRYSLYDINKREYITEYDYISLEPIESIWKLTNPHGKSIILNTVNSVLYLNENCYEEFNLKLNYTEYVWARKGNYFDYINRKTGKHISLPCIVMAYDTKYGMYGRDTNNKVLYFDESGVEDGIMLRKQVIDAGGYLKLTNYTYNLEDIIDVYGNILNV